MAERDRPERPDAGTDAAHGAKGEHDPDGLEQRVDEAERRADQARETAGEAAKREEGGRTIVEDVGGEAPRLDQREETPQARQ